MFLSVPLMTPEELQQSQTDDISVYIDTIGLSYPVFSHDGNQIFYITTTVPDTGQTNSTQGGVTYAGTSYETNFWKMDRDGTNQTMITSLRGIDHFSINPVTDTLAFSQYNNGTTGIYILNTSSGNKYRLENPLPDMYLSSWSPDGKQLAATGYNMSEYQGYSVMPDGSPVPGVGEEWSRLFVMNADGSNPRELSKVSVGELRRETGTTETSWSPDGMRIVAPLYRPDGVVLAVINATTGSTLELTSIPMGNVTDSRMSPVRMDPYPRWNPKNDTIAFIRNGNVWMIGADGSGERRIAGDGSVEALAWSPDGSRLAFSEDGYLGIMNADGSDLHRITNIQPHQLSWSPDGNTIVYGPGIARRIRITTLSPGVLKMGESMAQQMDRYKGNR